MNRSRAHHYVPRFYLKGFTDRGTEDGTIWLLNKRTRQCAPTGIAAVGMQRDYNTVYTEEGPSDELELKWADLEGHFATILEGIRTTRRLPTDDLSYTYLISLVASCLTRVPSSREAYRRLIVGIYQDIADHRFPGSYTVELKNDNFLVAEALRNIPEFAQDLSSYTWSLQLLQDDCPDVFTSDDPVLSGILGGPLLVFPLEKRLVLFGWREEGRQHGVVETEPSVLERERVCIFNGLMLMNARQFVYSSVDLPIEVQSEYLAAAREFFGRGNRRGAGHADVTHQRDRHSHTNRHRRNRPRRRR